MTELRDGHILLGGRLAHYAQAGDGPPVLVAPGLGLSTRFYEPTMRGFARAGLRLVVPDLPGCGRTWGPLTGMSVPQTADWLLELARALGIERPAWLGHSIGCQVAIDIAAREPARAAALVLAGPTGAPGHRLARQFGAFVTAIGTEPPGLMGAVLRDYVHVLPTTYFGTWIRAAHDDPVPKLQRVRCPAMVLVGHRDPIVPASFLAALLNGLPHARLARLGDGAHGLPRDSAGDFASAACDFLHETLAGG